MKSLVKSHRKRDSNPGSSSPEADALTTRPVRRCQQKGTPGYLEISCSGVNPSIQLSPASCPPSGTSCHFIQQQSYFCLVHWQHRPSNRQVCSVLARNVCSFDTDCQMCEALLHTSTKHTSPSHRQPSDQEGNLTGTHHMALSTLLTCL